MWNNECINNVRNIQCWSTNNSFITFIIRFYRLFSWSKPHKLDEVEPTRKGSPCYQVLVYIINNSLSEVRVQVCPLSRLFLYNFIRSTSLIQIDHITLSTISIYTRLLTSSSSSIQTGDDDDDWCFAATFVHMIG